jgi:parvulin-like peptidyl-prolyl isomerase
MKKICISVFLSLFLVGFLAAQSDLQPAAIVRLTKSEPITVKQLRTEAEKLVRDTLIQNLRRQPTGAEISTAVQSLTAADKRQVLDKMINEKLIMQAAERDKIIITDNDVNQQLTQFKNQMAQSLRRQPTDAEFGQEIRNQYGIELPAFREQLKQELLFQKYLMEKKKDVFTSFKAPTEEEIINFYKLRQAQMVRPETVRISRIQVPYTTASKTKAKEIADRLARDPSKFDDNVEKGKVQVRDPNAEFRAADAVYLPRSPEGQQLVGQDFMDTAFALKPGEISRVIEGIGAYEIIKVTASYEQKNLELGDFIQPGSTMTVREYISQGLSQQKEQAIIIKAQQELVTELRAGNPYQIMEANINF